MICEGANHDRDHRSLIYRHGISRQAESPWHLEDSLTNFAHASWFDSQIE